MQKQFNTKEAIYPYSMTGAKLISFSTFIGFPLLVCAKLIAVIRHLELVIQKSEAYNSL